MNKLPAANIVLAIVGLTVVNSTFVILLSSCANVGLTIFKCSVFANTQTVTCNPCGLFKDKKFLYNELKLLIN
ncbi:MAG: hypothetical protein U0V04_17995 [Spirosomataceae bacterium]